jgi:Bacteriophage Lambda NinG protein
MGRIMTWKGAKKAAWDELSIYVRRSANGVCFTCGGVKNWKTECDAGHFRAGSVCGLFLNFDLRNINCQCKRCNKYLHGNLGAYTMKLIEKYGPNIEKELNDDKLKHKNDKWEIKDFILIRDYYREINKQWNSLQ